MMQAGWTPLMHAAIERHSAICTALIERKADVNAKDNVSRARVCVRVTMQSRRLDGGWRLGFGGVMK